MNKVLKLLLLTAFLNCLTWISIIPLWQYPDEQAHFSQVQNLAEIGYVPSPFNNSREIDFSEIVMGTKRTDGNNSYVYHPQYKQSFDQNPIAIQEQAIRDLPLDSRKEYAKSESTQNPPLYYLLGAMGYKSVYNSDLFTRVFAARLVSALLFIALLYVAFQTSKLIFINKPFVQLSLTSLIAFMPMLVFASTGVLPDVLTNLLFAAVLYLSLRILKEGIRKKLLLWSLTVVFIGVNTRQQFLIAVPILLLAILIKSFSSKKILKRTVLMTLVVVTGLMLINIFGSEIPIIANFRFPESSALNPSQLLSGKFLYFTKWSLQKTYAESLPWYWGVYKWLSLTLPPLTYQIINRLLILSAIGIVIRIFLAIKRKKIEPLDFIMFYLISVSALYYLVFMLWDYFFFAQRGFSFGFQGRYYFPLIIAHMSIIVIGFLEIFRLTIKSYKAYGILTLVILMIIFNDFTLGFLANSYYDTSSLQTFITQASQYKPLFLKGPVLVVLPIMVIVLQALFVISLGKSLNKESTS